MEDDVNTRTCITPNFDLHLVNTSCPKDQTRKEVHSEEYSASTRSLVDCSDLEDDVVSTIYCNDWKEAVVGWRSAAPCVRYAWSQAKKHTIDGTGESKKNRGNVKTQKPHGKEVNWRCTVEPGTYRYSPGGFHRKIVEPCPSDHFTNSDERKLLIHLERVRDHFEKTLKAANKPAKLSSWKEKKSESRAPQKSASEGRVKESSAVGDAHSTRRRSKHDISEGDLTQTKSAELVAESSNHQQESRSHNLQEYQVHKVEINDPFSSEGLHRLRLTHLLEDHNNVRQRPTAMTGWGSSNSSMLLHQAGLLNDLNPLKKVTPQQRRIRDDHEFAEHRYSRGSNEFTEISARLPTSNSNSEPAEGRYKEKPKYTVLPTERFEQLCFRLDTDPDGNQSNMDTSSQYSQKDFSLAKELQSVQEILQASKYLSQQLNKKTDRKNHKTHRLRTLPTGMRGGGDLPHTEDLGEPLHRGIIDRKTASDLATELLPGVSGQGLNVPLYANRII